MSDLKLKRTTVYGVEGYDDIVAAIDTAVVTAVKDYRRSSKREDIRGFIEFTVRDGGQNHHVATYAIPGAKRNYYSTWSVFYPRGTSLVEIIFTTGVCDNECIAYGYVCKELSVAIAKRLIASIPTWCSQDANIRTLQALVYNLKTKFSTEAIYREAEAIGITDYKLVDIVLDGLN